MKFILKMLPLLALVFATGYLSAQSQDNDIIEGVTLIKLAQVPGEYETTELNLPPGKYIFEVVNKNVDKGLGFWLTPTDNPKAQVTNSGLSKLVGKGEVARTGLVELSAGEYQYSCPLNPTPHYSIHVQAGEASATTTKTK